MIMPTTSMSNRPHLSSAASPLWLRLLFVGSGGVGSSGTLGDFWGAPPEVGPDFVAAALECSFLQMKKPVD